MQIHTHVQDWLLQRRYTERGRTYRVYNVSPCQSWLSSSFTMTELLFPWQPSLSDGEESSREKETWWTAAKEGRDGGKERKRWQWSSTHGAVNVPFLCKGASDMAATRSSSSPLFPGFLSTTVVSSSSPPSSSSSSTSCSPPVFSSCARQNVSEQLLPLLPHHCALPAGRDGCKCVWVRGTHRERERCRMEKKEEGEIGAAWKVWPTCLIPVATPRTGR